MHGNRAESASDGGNLHGGRREQGSPSSTQPPPAASALSPSPFSSTQTAVRFALTYQPPDTGQHSAELLAQAGMVCAVLHKLGPFTLAVLSARVLPHTRVCSCGAPCCRGTAPNFDWQRSIEVISVAAFADIKVSLHPALARAIVIKAYQQRGHATKRLADEHMVAAERVYSATRQFRRWLGGGRGFPGVEPSAWMRADERLREFRVVADD